MAATTDTTRTIEIRQSPWEMLKLLAIGLAFVACSIFILYQGSILYIAIGWFGILFFGALTLVVVSRLLSLIGPVVTISPSGVRDVRVAADTIPWSAITDISNWSAFNQPAVILAVEKHLRLSLITRMTRRANASLGADGLAIASQGLSIGHDELLETLTAYWERAGGGQAQHRM
jgi:hypothetical protein